LWGRASAERGVVNKEDRKVLADDNLDAIERAAPSSQVPELRASLA
jgi:hypothetical protein